MYISNSIYTHENVRFSRFVKSFVLCFENLKKTQQNYTYYHIKKGIVIWFQEKKRFNMIKSDSDLQ